MPDVVVIGGGWSGCAAALSAARAGARVKILERTDQLLGTGLVGGIMRNNGRFTAAEEAIAMGGGGYLFNIADSVARHRNVEFPGHHHATLYDVSLIEPAVRRFLLAAGIEISFEARAVDVKMHGNRIVAVKTEDGKEVEADCFVETTGTAGPQGNCLRYGNGCVMCILRCPAFGPRVSIAAKAGVEEKMGSTAKGTIGAMSGSCKIHKDSLSREVRADLEDDGVAIVPIPEEMQKKEALLLKACQQYALPEYAQNVVLLDTGHAKLMTSYFPLDKLRQIPGLENARYEDPYAASRGNSMRYFAMSPHDETLKVRGLANLFCAGEKAGPLVGHTEAMSTGMLAGHNAVRYALGMKLITIPRSLAIGDAIAYVTEQMESPEGLTKKYTFSGSVYFERMKELGLYSTDVHAIKQRVKEAGMAGVFEQSLV